MSVCAPCVYHWRCLDYHYKCYLFILSYFSKLGDFFTDNIKPAFPTLFKTIGLGIFPTFIQCVVWVMCFNISLEKVLSRWMSCIKVKRLTSILRPHVFLYISERIWNCVAVNCCWSRSGKLVHCLSRRSYYSPHSLNILQISSLLSSEQQYFINIKSNRQHH